MNKVTYNKKTQEDGRSETGTLAGLSSNAVWIALGLLAAGATGAIGGYLALSKLIANEVATQLQQPKIVAQFKGADGKNGIDGVAGTNAEFPSGIVVATWRSCSSLGSSWSDFHAAAGRMIVGAGDPVKDPFNGELEMRVAWEPDMKSPTTATVGGSEKVILDKRHMPTHSHSIENLNISNNGHMVFQDPDWGVMVDNQKRVPGPIFGAARGKEPNFGSHSHSLTGTLGASGQNVAHENMPPYIALYFCRKD